MAEEGFDVAVSPATAYSTLGWFDDPLLDTMLRYTEYRLAGVLFHELAHQRLYIKDDATFNESFASAVERGGIEAWLHEQGDEEQKIAWVDGGARQRDFNALVSGVRRKLSDLYQSASNKQTIAEQKSAIFAELRNDYQGLKATWNSYNGYDRWFAQDLNNAHFALHATYENGTAAFECLLQENGRDFEAFYEAATEISNWTPERRAAWLAGHDSQSVHCAANKSMRP